VHYLPSGVVAGLFVAIRVRGAAGPGRRREGSDVELGRAAAESSYLDMARSPTRDPRKSAEKLAFRIARDVIGANLAEGSLLGSERDLLERYAVSRAIFREAVRLLEYHSLVKTRAGRRYLRRLPR
jgi:hypothetical protein